MSHTHPPMKCEIQKVENALTHAISYINHSKVLNDISLYESRLTRIIACNHDLLMKRQDRRLHVVKQTHPAELPETRVQTAGATARTILASNCTVADDPCKVGVSAC